VRDQVAQEMYGLYSDGLSLGEVGVEYDITAERKAALSGRGASGHGREMRRSGSDALLRTYKPKTSFSSSSWTFPLAPPSTPGPLQMSAPSSSRRPTT
jgi:hypothetical protein